MQRYDTIAAQSEIQRIIHKSKFIGRCFPVECEEDALTILAEIRKQHWDATHNCYAYRIGKAGETARFSDDGEPGGTAGLPMMEVLTAKNVTNALCIVTRYFGGVLLGAGGLVRAYSGSAAEAVQAAGILHMIPAKTADLMLDYSRYGAVEGYVRQTAQVDGMDFLENVTMHVTVAAERYDAFAAEIVERTDGRCAPAPTGEGYLQVASD